MSCPKCEETKTLLKEATALLSAYNVLLTKLVTLFAKDEQPTVRRLPKLSDMEDERPTGKSGSSLLPDTTILIEPDK